MSTTALNDDRSLRRAVGSSASVCSALYVLSDAMELAHGGLYPAQLIVTYLAEASIPFFVLGLHALQHRQAGWLSMIGAVLYGFGFVGFSATVLYPLVTGIRSADDVFAAFGRIYGIHAILTLVGGALFGVSVIRARVFPAWTGALLILGLLVSVALVGLGLSEGVQTLGTALRSVAFIGMGVSCFRGSRKGTSTSSSSTKT